MKYVEGPEERAPDGRLTKEGPIHTMDDPGSVELLKGAGIVFSGRLIGRGLGFFSHFLFARFLGPSHYGGCGVGREGVSRAA